MSIASEHNEYMSREELNEILERHHHWIKRDVEDWQNMEADLSYKIIENLDLKGVDFTKSNLKGTRFKNCNLSEASFCRCNLRFAAFENADLSEADLSYSDMSYSKVRNSNLDASNLTGVTICHSTILHVTMRSSSVVGADFTESNLMNVSMGLLDLTDVKFNAATLMNVVFPYSELKNAEFNDANLNNVKFTRSDLRFASMDSAIRSRIGKILTEPMIGYKKTHEGKILTAEIPVGAIVFCINENKCRSNRARITDLDGASLLHSGYDSEFEYHLGQEIEIIDFDLRYNVECANGFHFFRTREEAEKY